MQLPDDVVILEVEGHGRKEVVKELPLRDIPDSEASTLRRGIAFVEAEQRRGNNKAAGDYCFERDDMWSEQLIHYRVASRNR